MKVTAGRVGWAVLGLLLAAVTVVVSLREGVAATVAAVVFIFLPLVRWWPLRSVWIPLAGLVAYTVWPLWPPLFGAGLGWLVGIAALRVFGRPEHRGEAVAEPRRLGLRLLGLDLSPERRRAPGPRAGRAAIPKPVPRKPGVLRKPGVAQPDGDARPGVEPDAGPDQESPGTERGTPAPPGRAEPRPPAKPANREPRAAAKPDPKRAGRPEPGPASRPRRGQEPGSGR